MPARLTAFVSGNLLGDIDIGTDFLDCSPVPRAIAGATITSYRNFNPLCGARLSATLTRYGDLACVALAVDRRQMTAAVFEQSLGQTYAEVLETV